MRTSRPIFHLSIKHRLPLLIGALLSGIIIASIWASYRSVKESALEVGSERLRNLTQQLASLSQQSTVSLLTRTFAAANEPAVRAFVRAPSSGTRPAASAILQQFIPPQDPNSLQVELWHADRSLAMIAPDGTTPVPAALDSEFKQCASDPFRASGPLVAIEDSAIYSVAAAVKDETGKPIGYLVRWRRVSPTPNAQKQLADLLGSQATLYYGNIEGDVWTDLEKIVPRPPTVLTSTLEVAHYTHDGKSVMALARPISGTQLFVVVEFPDQIILGPAHHLLRRLIGIGLGLLVVGVAGSLVLSRNITGPLRSLTETASAISAGDYSRTVDIRQTDELGTLASAFNTMIVKVRQSQLKLERKIEESKQAEEAASKLAAIVMSSDDAIIGKTLDGIITTWNAGATKLFGYAESETLGVSITLLIPPELLSEEDQILERIRRGESVRHFETVRQAKGGRLIEVSVTVSPIKNAANKTIGASKVARDITDRKQGEKDLQAANQRLEQALAEVVRKGEELALMTQQLWQASKLAMMGELAASIAHELNNPLATVALRAESLLMQLPESDPKRGSLEVITREVDRMATLVNNLLQFNRRSHLQVSTVDVREEIVNSIEFVHYHLRNHRIEVVREFAADVPTIQADRQQLRQLFLNLLTNAGDAMPQGGTVTLRVRPKLTGSEANSVVVEFADTGEGIAPADHNKIWDPFFTTKPEGRGTGLGLAICRRIVEEHGGTIEIESEISKGTIVRITFPATSNGAVVHLL